MLCACQSHAMCAGRVQHKLCSNQHTCRLRAQAPPVVDCSLVAASLTNKTHTGVTSGVKVCEGERQTVCPGADGDRVCVCVHVSISKQAWLMFWVAPRLVCAALKCQHSLTDTIKPETTTISECADTQELHTTTWLP